MPAELRPLLRKYEQQRVEFVNEKAREAATVRARAAEEVQRANAMIAQAAQWWRQTGPALQRAFADKWAQVDWKTLAEKDPAEYARLDQDRHGRGRRCSPTPTGASRQDTKAATERAAQALEQAKQRRERQARAHAARLFRQPGEGAQTYDELGKFLFAKGIPADRIDQIHEAPIIELALAAMRFEQAQKKASPVLRSSEGTVTTANTTARATPTRVAPGPASRAGNRTSDAARQAGERFRKSGGNSIADAAELIRLNGVVAESKGRSTISNHSTLTTGGCLAAPTNTLITNNAVGNRESLHNIISILNKDETPFQAAIGSGSAEATYEEWQLDTLGNADTNNAQLEGDDTTASAIVPTTPCRQSHADPEEAVHHLGHPGGREEGRPRQRDQLPDRAGRPSHQDGSRGDRLPEPGVGRAVRRHAAQDGRPGDRGWCRTSRAARRARRAASPRATPWHRPTARSAPRPRRCSRPSSRRPGMPAASPTCC